MTTMQLSRRGLLVAGSAAGGGLMLGVALPAAAQGATPEVNAWVVIRPDETVVVRVAKVEMGQGTLTGLAQLVAEELEADWSKVTTEYPTPGQSVARKRPWGDFMTAGSRGIRSAQEQMRKGAAAARMMLVQAAADQWKVPVAECSAAKGVVTHGASGRKLTYGKLAPAAAKLQAPTEITLKDPKTWTIAGKPLPRLDTREKLDGSQVYSMDVKLPNMLNAAVRMAPVLGGKVKRYDASTISGLPGVKKVVPIDDNGVAVVADTWWRANSALSKLEIEWDLGANTAYNSADFDKVLDEGLSASEAFVGNQQGDVAAALKGAAKRVEAVYKVPHQHHATMEPLNATAVWTPESCTVWTSTQNAEAALTTVERASGLPLAQCEVHRLSLGGGFGRRGFHDYVEQAVKIAKQMPGIPVKLIWTREEDMLHGRYHPITKAKMTGALDKNGDLVGLHMRIAGQSIMATVNPQGIQPGKGDPILFQGLNPKSEEGEFGYTVPNLLIDHAMRNPGAPAGYWRGVCNNQNAIYLECFIDELAEAAGKDPLEFRRKLLRDHPKHLAVLNAVADKAWGKPVAPGVSQGLCVHMGYGSYVAAVADVSVDDEGAITIHRVVAATNPGHAVNPQQIAAQVEGSFAYGLSALLYGEITFENGQAQQTNFDSYSVMRLADMPAVESIIAPTYDFWGGVGEPTIFAATPAVINAVSKAIGRRVREVPLSKADLKKA